ncbi:MAG: two-component regulator propeller domain-containing protein [Pseudomonadota bacterium]
MLLICYLVQTPPVRAGTYRFVHFNYDTHFLAAKINTVAQDSMGYVWFGTDFGLQRFDGTRVYVYPNSSAIGKDIPSRWITDLEADRTGYLWIGTDSGLSRLDPVTMTATRDFFQPTGADSLLQSHIVRIKSDGRDRLWIATIQGLARLDTKTGEVRIWRATKDSVEGLSSNDLTDMAIDRSGNAWVGTSNHGLNRVDAFTGEVRHFSAAGLGAQLLSDAISAVAVDSSDNLWIGYPEKGVTKLETVTESAMHYPPTGRHLSGVADDAVRSIYVSSDGRVWFGTESTGIFLLPASGDANAINVRDNPSDPDGLRSSQVSDILEDRNGNMWLTSHGHGAYFFRASHRQVDTLSAYSSQWNQLKDNIVWSVFEDSDSRLWIGGNSHGLQLLDPNNRTSRNFKHDPNDENTLSSDMVLDVSQTQDGAILLGTIAGLDHIEPETGTVRRLLPSGGADQQLLRVASVFEDSRRWLWLATLGNGLYRYRINDDPIVYRSGDAEKSISDDFVTAIVEDEEGHLWIGSKGGLDRLDVLNDGFTHFELPSNRILALAYDEPRKRFLVGTDNGLVIFDKEANTSRLLTERDGLAGEKVYCILRAQSDYLVATSDGISILRLDDTLENYYESHGLQFGYNLGACQAGRDGKYYFAGNRGVASFQLQNLKRTTAKPISHVIGLRAYDRRLGGQYQDEEIAQSRVALPYYKNDLRISFAGIYFEDQRTLAHHYRLLGFDSKWRTYERIDPTVHTKLRSENEVAYTNLGAGTYTFEIKHQSSDGVWSEPATLTFHITPPWYQTWPAFLLYFATIAVSLFGLLHWRVRALITAKVRLEAQVAERTQQLAETARTAQSLADQKSALFANVSHEFRTPLTLILGPVNSLRKRLIDDRAKGQLASIERNALRLLRMVEQLIDIAVLDSDIESPRATYDVEKTLRAIVEGIETAVANRDVRLLVDYSFPVHVRLVRDSLEKIVTNLVLNAIKYSDDNSTVTIRTEESDGWVSITVNDEGPGIARDDQALIFERFRRLDEQSKSHTVGAGLGLAIVKELVAANDGKLDIDSALGRGTRMTVAFPVVSSSQDTISAKRSQLDNLEKAVVADVASIVSYPAPSNSYSIPPDSAIATILIVEDSLDMQQLIAEQLGQAYALITADDGDEAIELATQHVPDLVILDVMLPTVDGFQVASQLREHMGTCHIPIVMLTAKADLASRMTGWRSNVDEYLAKPFHPDELRLRVENLLEIRKILREKYGRDLGHRSPIEALPKTPRMAADRRFLERFEQIVAENYANPYFDRSQAARFMAVSERQLNRKLSYLVDHNFSAYLRRFRLRKSLELLGRGLRITQIAESVGFSNSSYFSSCFKTEYGYTVKQYESKLPQDE